jgi:hypothetical protein
LNVGFFFLIFTFIRTVDREGAEPALKTAHNLFSGRARATATATATATASMMSDESFSKEGDDGRRRSLPASSPSQPKNSCSYYTPV